MARTFSPGISRGSLGGTAARASTGRAAPTTQGPTLGVFRGWIDGDTLVYESLSDALPRIRLTWIMRDADHCLWRNEASLDGVSWTLIEEYRMEAAT